MLCGSARRPLSHFDPADTACCAGRTHDHHSVGGRVGQNALLALRVAQQVLMMMMLHQLLGGVVVLQPTAKVSCSSRRAVVVSARADRRRLPPD